MKNIINSITPQVAIPLWGIIGGLALMFIAGLEQNAEAVIPIFGFTLVLSILTIKQKRTDNLFNGFFITTLLTFTIMLSIDYIYMINVVNPSLLTMPLFGHIWRIVVILAIGAIVSLILAYATVKIKNRSSIVST